MSSLLNCILRGTAKPSSFFTRTIFNRTILCLFIIYAPFQALSVEADCGIESLDSLDSSVVYKSRGNFCEGIYEEGYSTDNEILLVGYHLHSIAYTKGLDKSAKIAVEAPSGEAVNVIFLDTLASKFYRRDQTLTGGEPVDWPLKIISDEKVSLSANQLVGIGCSPKCHNQNSIYYPVSVYVKEQPVIKPSIHIEFPVGTAGVRLTAIDPLTKKTIMLPGTEDSAYLETRSFNNSPIKLIEVFTIPVFNETVIIQLNVILRGRFGKKKNIATSFRLGNANS